MKKLFKILGILLLFIIVLGIGAFTYIKVHYPVVKPAPDLKIIANPEMIERGRYLANGFAGCMDCHSTRDFNKLSGPVVKGTEGMGGQDFGEGAGFVPARNITPDKETGIGNWTDGEIYRAIVYGIDKEGNFLAPMMPYSVFSTLDENDIKSIIAYVRTIPAIRNQLPPKNLNFPVNLIFRTLPGDDPQFTKFTNNTIERGKYYSVSCNFCHTPNEKGKFKEDEKFSGGNEINMPDGSILKTANLTSDKETGIGNWTKEMFIERFRAFRNPENIPKTGPGDFNTIMPWSEFAKTSDEDLGAIYDYIRTFPPIKKSVVKFTPAKK
jgi:hypothetical protein